MNKKICTFVVLAFFCFSGVFPAALVADTQKYMISGMVVNKNDESPIRDAEIRLAGDKVASEKTDIFGYYQIENVEAGSHIDISAEKEGMIFSPSVLKISAISSNRTINFTAVAEQSGSKRSKTKQAQPAASSSDSQDVHVISSPASGVSKAQPEYVTEAKPFFASDGGAKSKNQQSADTPSKPTFDLSGKVVYYASGLVGVRVMVNNDRKIMTTTDINGYYSINGLKSGQNYLVTFSRDGYIFNPSECEIVSGDRDFVFNVEATLSKHKISGKISEGKTGIEGVMVKIVSGVDEFTAYTDGNGNYETKGLSHGSNYFVVASKEGVMITPPKVTVNKLDNDRAINFNGVVQKFSIGGTVKDLDGVPLKGAEVMFKTTFDTFKATTNSKGKYILEEVPMALTYTLTASKEGYVESDPFIVESLDKNREVDFQIKKESKKETEKAAAVSASKDKKTSGKKVSAPDISDESAQTSKKSGKTSKEKAADLKKGAAAKDDNKEKEEKKLKAEQEERERKEKLEEKRKAEQEERERKEAEELSKQEKKQKAEQEKIEQRRIAEQEENERKEAEELSKQEKKQKAEQEKIEQKRIAEQEARERKEAEELSKQEKKQRAQDEKALKKKIEADEKLEKEKKKEAEKQTKLETEQQAKEDTKVSSSAKTAEKKTSKAKEKDKGAAEKVSAAAAAEKPEKITPVSSVSSKEKMVKIRGKIESMGEPLKNIELTLSHGYSTKTDEKGKYEISVPAGARYVVKPHAADFYFDPHETVYDELKSNAVQDFVPYITVEGEVFGAGKGIADVSINVNGTHAVSTNQFGKYKIEKIEYGLPLNISAAKNGVTFFPGAAEIGKAVKNRENVNFTVSYSVSGKITVQGSGMGLGNISMEVAGSADAVVSTDFSGNFIVSGLSQGGSFEIIPKTGGYSFTPPSRKFTALRESFVGQNFTAVKETYTVKGNVNIGGKPIRNAQVSISKRPLKYYTDDEGNFTVSNLDYGGPYTLNVISSEHDFEPIVIETLDKDTQVEFSTDISLGGVVVSGRKPISGVIVDVNGKKSRTDENGKYLITGLKYNGDYLLSLSAPGIMFSPSQKEYNGIKKSVLNETFNASALMNGKITLDGKPFAGADIIVSGDAVVYKSDSNGYFLIKDLTIGQDYTLEVSSPGYKFSPPKREYKNLSSGKMAEHFKASVDGISIRGTVVAEGRPLKKVAVSVDGASKAQTYTDENGQFVFDGLPANKKYEITVLSKMHKFEAPAAVFENLGSDKEITLEPGKVLTISEDGSKPAPKTKTVYYKVSGKITSEGAPLKGVSVASDEDETLTNAAGEYTITLSAGSSTEIRPSLYGYVFSPEKLDVKSIKAAASNMNFSARSNMHALSGHVVNKDLKGVKGVSVKDFNSSEDFMTDSKGSYKVSGLSHKTVSLIAPDSEDYDFFPENIEIALESDLTANDIYAYPKKLKKAEAFIYGGINSAVNVSENYVSIVLVSPEGGKASVKIKSNKGGVIKEFETNLTANKSSVINWDGLMSTGADAETGNYSAVIDGAGFKGESLNFRIFE